VQADVASGEAANESGEKAAEDERKAKKRKLTSRKSRSQDISAKRATALPLQTNRSLEEPSVESQVW